MTIDEQIETKSRALYQAYTGVIESLLRRLCRPGLSLERKIGGDERTNIVDEYGNKLASVWIEVDGYTMRVKSAVYSDNEDE